MVAFRVEVPKISGAATSRQTKLCPKFWPPHGVLRLSVIFDFFVSLFAFGLRKALKKCRQTSYVYAFLEVSVITHGF